MQFKNQPFFAIDPLYPFIFHSFTQTPDYYYFIKQNYGLHLGNGRIFRNIPKIIFYPDLGIRVLGEIQKTMKSLIVQQYKLYTIFLLLILGYNKLESAKKHSYFLTDR